MILSGKVNNKQKIRKLLRFLLIPLVLFSIIFDKGKGGLLQVSAEKQE